MYCPMTHAFCKAHDPPVPNCEMYTRSPFPDSSDYKEHHKFRGPPAHRNTKNIPIDSFDYKERQQVWGVPVPIDSLDYKESRNFWSRPTRSNTRST